MSQQCVVSRYGTRAYRCLPLLVRGWKLELAQDQIDDAVQEVVLIGDVVVERHGLDAQHLPELAHGERVDPILIDELDGGAHYAIPAQRSAALALHGHRSPLNFTLDKLTP